MDLNIYRIKWRYIIILIVIILGFMVSLNYYFPITHPLKNNYIGMTRTDVTKTLFNKDKKVVIYFNSNYREFSKIADMRNCSKLLKSDKWEIDFYKSNGKIFSYILHFKDNIVESQEISRRRDGP